MRSVAEPNTGSVVRSFSFFKLAQPLPVSGFIHVPQRRHLKPGHACAAKLVAGLHHDLRRAPSYAFKRLGHQHPHSNQHVAAVFCGDQHHVVLREGLRGLLQVARREQGAVGADQQQGHKGLTSGLMGRLTVRLMGRLTGKVLLERMQHARAEVALRLLDAHRASDTAQCAEEAVGRIGCAPKRQGR